MFNKKPKEQTTAEQDHGKRVAERQHKLYNMPEDFKRQVLDFEVRLGDKTWEEYAASLGAINFFSKENPTSFLVVDRENYLAIQLLWDGLQELRRRRKFAQECEMKDLAEIAKPL